MAETDPAQPEPVVPDPPPDSFPSEPDPGLADWQERGNPPHETKRGA